MSDQVWNNGKIWQTICPEEFVAMIVGALITTLSSHLSRVAPCHDLKHCLLLMGRRLLSWWRVSLFWWRNKSWLKEGGQLHARGDSQSLMVEIFLGRCNLVGKSLAHLFRQPFYNLTLILSLSNSIQSSVLRHTGKSCDPRMTSAGLRRWWWTGAGADQGVAVRGAPTLRAPFPQLGDERSRLFLTCTTTTSQELH